MSLMERRHALMRQKEMVNHLLYSLDNYSVTAGERINTDVYPFADDISCTILLDYTFTNVTTNNAPGLFINVMNVWNTTLGATSFTIARDSNRYSPYNCKWQGVSTAMNSAPAGGRNRFAVTHEAGSDVVKVSFKSNTSTRRNYSYTQTFTPAPTNPLFFGGTANGTGSLAEGTITSAKVYDKVLSAAEINAFFA